MAKDTKNQWAFAAPSYPGSFRVHDTVFGQKFSVVVYEADFDLFVRPEDEPEDGQAVVLHACPWWWRWKENTKTEMQAKGRVKRQD
jgi:hypothetical protein